MRLALLAAPVLVSVTACGAEDDFCGYPPQWKISVSDDPAPLTPEPGEPVASLSVRASERCQRSLALDQFYVTFDTPPDYLVGKTTRAIHPENLLVSTLVDENGDGRLGARESLLLAEGPEAVVPPGIEWVVWLMLRHEDGGGGSGMARATLLSE